jgi:glycosyltransferase involved in cell wall biosynthesis
MLKAFRKNQHPVVMPSTLPDGSAWPRISIVTPSYNNAKYIEETIISVLEQGYPDVEHIIVDGASKDGTAAILDRYRGHVARIIQEPDTGQSNAINKGMRLATGEIVTWLNSDDLLAPGALAAVAMAFHMSGADMVAGGCQLYRNGGYLGTHLTSCADGTLPAEEISDLYGGWQTGKFFYQPEVMFTRDLWQRAGGQVREDLHYCMDVEMWLRFASCGARLHVIGAPVAMFRLHEEQKTNNPDASPDEYIPVANAWRTTHGLPPITRTTLPPPPPPLKVAFVNDIGFQYGAGIAHQRLFTAVSSAGHTVRGWATGFQSPRDVFEATAARIISEIEAFEPDVVVCGNLHCTIADSDMLVRLTDRWPTCFCLHDLWLLTGHCPHPGFLDCVRHLAGCDHTCPSPDTYPTIAAGDIRKAWDAKRKVMARDTFLALANSNWTRAQHDGCTTPGHEARLLRLGCDESIFHPGDRLEARRQLGLDMDAFVVLMPMVDFSSPFKGSVEGLEALSGAGLENLQVICFGVVKQEMIARFPILTALGYLHDPEAVATAYRAADVVVSFSHAETFGQTLMEAACCGTPSLAYRCTGLPDAVVDGVSGFLVDETPDALITRLHQLHADANLRASLGTWAALYARNSRCLQAEYHSFHTNLEEAGLLAPGRLGKNIFFAHTEAHDAEPSIPVSDPRPGSAFKNWLRRELPTPVWMALRRVYRGTKSRLGMHP